MIQTKEYKIKSCDDIELGIKRKSKLRFILSYDDEKDINAIVCIIPGIGGDADASYKEHLANSIASNHNVAVLSVDYHSIGCNFELGAKMELDEIDKMIFRTCCEQIELNLEEDFEKKCSNEEYLNNTLKAVENYIAFKKQRGDFKPNYLLDLHFTIMPTNDEYQNFGIMSASDVINAVLYTQKNLPFKTTKKADELGVILFGSSHGGYIANMCAKIAPWLIDAVVDNSSWCVYGDVYESKDFANAAFRFLSFGREIDFIEYSRAGLKTDKIFFHFSNKTFWTSNRFSPNYCSKSRLDIRDYSKVEHLKTQSKVKKAIYRCYQSIKDKISYPDKKEEFCANLAKLGFDVKLNVIKDEKQIDGKFIKNLEHGMGMSIKMLINKELPPLLNALKDKKAIKAPKEVLYQTDEWAYSFKQKGDKLCLECSKIG